jgi:hypothetical protein
MRAAADHRSDWAGGTDLVLAQHKVGVAALAARLGQRDAILGALQVELLPAFGVRHLHRTARKHGRPVRPTATLSSAPIALTVLPTPVDVACCMTRAGACCMFRGMMDAECWLYDRDILLGTLRHVPLLYVACRVYVARCMSGGAVLRSPSRSCSRTSRRASASDCRTTGRTSSTSPESPTTPVALCRVDVARWLHCATRLARPTTPSKWAPPSANQQRLECAFKCRLVLMTTTAERCVARLAKLCGQTGYALRRCALL